MGQPARSPTLRALGPAPAPRPGAGTHLEAGTREDGQRLQGLPLRHVFQQLLKFNQQDVQRQPWGWKPQPHRPQLSGTAMRRGSRGTWLAARLEPSTTCVVRGQHGLSRSRPL